MLLKFFRRVQVKDPDVMKLQSQVEQVLNPLLKIPVLDGVMLTDISVGTTDTVIEHKLMRKPLGWIVVDSVSDNRIWRTDWTDRTITLRANSANTFNLWVF